MSQDEMVDVVNQNDEVVGQVAKSEAHVKGLLHRTVIGMVVGNDSRWTFVKQSSDRQDAGQYVSPVGGHVSSGETEDQALEREAMEEYGLTKGDFTYKLIGKAIFDRYVRGRHENHYFIFYEIYTDRKPVLNEESTDTRSFSRQELQLELKSNPSLFGDAFHFVAKTFYPELLS